MAAVLRYGRSKRGDYTDAMVQSAAIQEAVKKIHLTVLDPSELPVNVDPARYQAAVVLRLKDGREIQRRLPYPSGRYDDPTPKSVFVLPKFRENASVCLSETDTERCIEAVQQLENLNGFHALTSLIEGSQEVD